METTEALAQALARWRAAAGPSKEDYTVGPQDMLSVSLFVASRADVGSSLQVPVTEQGDVTLPLVGQVHVEGLTATEIGRTLSALYADGYYRDPDVTVAVTGYASKRVLVTGAVAQPQTIVLKQNSITLLEALLEAGGPAEKSGNLVRLTPAEAGLSGRGETPGQPRRRGRSRSSSRTSSRTCRPPRRPGLPGDVVYVPTAPTRTYYVLGYVRARVPTSSRRTAPPSACSRPCLRPRAGRHRPGRHVRLVRQTPRARRSTRST